MCSLLTRIQTTKIPRIESQLKLSRFQHVSQQRPLNQIRPTTFAQPAVSATLTHNQLTQGSIQRPLRYQVVITFQKNQSGSSSVSPSTVCFAFSPGTTIPHAPRNVFSLATGNTFVPKSPLFPLEAIELICSPLSQTTSCNHSVFTARALSFPQSSSLRNASRGH